MSDVRHIKPPFTSVSIREAKPVSVQWNVKLGRLAEGYARGGDHVKGKIRIAQGQDRSGARIAILHEIMHELWVTTGLRQWLSQRTEELVIDTLATEIIDVLRRNPKLAAFLLEYEEATGSGA